MSVLIWLLKNWRVFLAGASVVAVCMGGWNEIRVGWLNASHASEIAKMKSAQVEQEKNLKAACEESKKITEDVSNEFQKNLAARDDALAAARKLLDRKCPVPVVVAKTSSGRDATACSGKPAGSDDKSAGVDANALLDIAAEGEKYRIQLIGCQDFVRKLK